MKRFKIFAWLSVATIWLLLITLQLLPPEFVYQHFVVGRAQADITDLTGYTGKIGQEDISYGTGQDTDTFTITGYNGATVTLTKVPAIAANIASIIKGVWYVEQTAGDQCDVALDGSLAWVTNVINGDNATIHIPGDQAYSCDTSYSIPSNIVAVIDNGALFTLGDGVTMTSAGTLNLLNSNSTVFQGGAGGGTETIAVNGGLIAEPSQQIFGSDLTVNLALGAVPVYYPGWRGFSTAESGANNQTYLTNTISDITAGQVIEILPGSYTVAGNWTINKACTVQGVGELDFSTDAASQGILVTASGVKLKDFILTGPAYLTRTGTQKGINAYGADSSNYINGLIIDNMTISNWGEDAIFLQYVEDFKITKVDIDNCYYAGILGLSAVDGVVTGNNINNIVGTPLAYGIIWTRNNNDSLATEPRSARIITSNNIVKSVPNWECLDTHAGESITFANNNLYGCEKGIALGAALNTASEATFGPLNCSVLNNTINSGVTDGTEQHGIALVGAKEGAVVNQYAEGNRVIGNTIIGHGDKTNSEDGATYFTSSKGLIIDSNAIIDGSGIGIQIYHDVQDFSITNNTIIDAWNDSGTAKAIRIDGDENTGYIAGNSMIKDDSAKTQVMDYGILIDNATGNLIQLGQNYFSGIVISNIHDPGFKAWRGQNVSDTVTSGTGEDDLKSLVITEDTLGTGQIIKISAAFANTGANDTKTGKFHFGASEWTIYPANNDQYEWFADIVITIISKNSQKLTIQTTDGNNAIVYNQYTTAAIDLTAADTTVKFTGECANAGDTVTQYTFNASYE